MNYVIEVIETSMNTQIKMNFPNLNKDSLSIYAIFSTVMNGYNMSFNQDEFEKIKNYNS